MKIVNIKRGSVREILPATITTLEDVVKWYGATFAAECVEAPDEVAQNMTYDAETGTFAEPVAEDTTEPVETTPDADEDQNAMLVDHEYRITLIELGVSE